MIKNKGEIYLFVLIITLINIIKRNNNDYRRKKSDSDKNINDDNNKDWVINGDVFTST